MKYLVSLNNEPLWYDKDKMKSDYYGHDTFQVAMQRLHASIPFDPARYNKAHVHFYDKITLEPVAHFSMTIYQWLFK